MRLRASKDPLYFTRRRANGAKYDSQGQATSEARRVAPGSCREKRVEP